MHFGKNIYFRKYLYYSLWLMSWCACTAQATLLWSIPNHAAWCRPVQQTAVVAVLCVARRLTEGGRHLPDELWFKILGQIRLVELSRLK